jgi:hypothetical protein
MTTRCCHLCGVLAVLALSALTCFAAPEDAGIHLSPVCRDVFYIFDTRKDKAVTPAVHINGSTTTDVIKLPPGPDKDMSIYKASLHDNSGIEWIVSLTVDGTEIFKGTTKRNNDDKNCRIAAPCIFTVSPDRILEGGTLTITGIDFGSRNTDLTLYLRNDFPIKPEWLSKPDKEQVQTARFLIPTKAMEPTLYEDSAMWMTSAWISVSTRIGDQESDLSNWKTVGLIRGDAKTWLFVACLGITIWLVFLLYKLVRRCSGMSCTVQQMCLTLFYDKSTNTYSLSKLQALGWTIVVLWSYLFLALGKILLTGDFSIPDLDPSILELLGISYGGLLTARGVGKAFPKNDLAATKPTWCDLFSENNEISLPRLQLFAFTCIGYLIFVVASFKPDFFQSGLPTIPGTLNGLFLVSQLGYLGGKVTGASAVSHVLPRRITAPFSTPVILFGKSLTDKTTILVQGLQDAIATTFLNQNAVQFSLSGKSLDPGTKQLVLIPPTGNSFVIDNALEIVAPKIRKTLRTDPSGHPALEVDFIGIVLNGEPLTAHLLLQPSPTPPGGTPPSNDPQGDTPVSVAHLAGNRYTVTRPGGLTTGGTLRIAALDGSFAFETTVNGTATEGYEPVTLR